MEIKKKIKNRDSELKWRRRKKILKVMAVKKPKTK